MPNQEPTTAACAVDPKPLARGRKSTRKREAIMRAAVKVINERSYALATMTEIAAQLDLRDATLYYYFPSKQALALACHVRSLELFERLLIDADRSETTGLMKLTQFIRRMLEDADRHGPQLYFGDYTYLDADDRLQIGSWAARLTAVLEGFLVDGMADGSVITCEPPVVVQLLLGMLIWLAKWVPSIEGMTVDRLMASIGVASLAGLARPSLNASEQPDGARVRSNPAAAIPQVESR